MLSKKKLLLTTLIFTFCTFSFTVGATAQGGKWTSNITYYVPNNDAYLTNIRTAVNDWNNVLGQYTTLTIRTADVLGAKVTASSAYYGTDVCWTGMGEPGPNPYSGTYTYGSVRLNRSHLDNKWYITQVATHEFGHILGLAHAYENVSSIMSLFNNAPTITSYDKAEIDKIY
jgi:predicted Zn-dependent protease